MTAAVRAFKRDDKWSFSAEGRIEHGFSTKDEALMVGEKYVADKRRAEDKARREARAEKKAADERLQQEG
jgi:hypothetical protein